MPILQVRKQRLREAKQLSLGRTAGKQGLAVAVLSATKQGGRTRAPAELDTILSDLHHQA